MKAFIYKFTFVFLVLLYSFNQRIQAQTVTITAANTPATNGITASPMISSKTGAVVLGFTVAVSGGSVNFNQFVLGASAGYFSNAKLYRSTAGSVSYTGATLVTTINAGTYMGVGVNETISNTSYTYFLVVDLSVPGYVTLPANLQFSFSQAIRPSPYTAYNTAINGINYTLNNPTYTLTSANTSGNGITQGNVIAAQTGVVLFGFGISANATTTVSGFNLNSSSTGSFLSGYLGNAKLYRSASSTFSVGTATLINAASIAFSTYQHTPGVAITGLTESISTTTVYYFIVADFNQTSGTLPANLTLKFETSQTNAIIQGAPNSANIAAPSNITGSTLTFSNPSYTITSANGAANGITQGNLTPGETGIVLFGFGVSTNANATVTGFNVANSATSTATAYFNNGKIYRSASSTFSLATATPINTATVNFTSSSTAAITVTGLTESYTANASPVYYFIVGDFYATYYGTVPGTTQFNFNTSQTNPIVQSSPVSNNVTVASNVTGTNFSLAFSTLTVTGYNNISNGITGGALTYGQTDIVLFGFKVDVSGVITVNQISIPSNISTNAYFSNGRLYRSTTSNFSDASPVSGAVVSFPNTATTISGLSEIFNSYTGASGYYYFLVADFNASTSYSPGTLKYDFANGSTSFIQTTPYRTFTNASTSNGYSYVIGSIYDWVGTNANKDFTVASNWRINGSTPATGPSANDLVRIGVVAYQYPSNQPSISAATTTIGQLTFGSNNTPVLTLGSAVTGLTVTKGINVTSGTATIATSGTSTITLPSTATSVLTTGTTLNYAGQISNAGIFTIPSGATVNLTGTNGKLTNSGTFNQLGTLTLASSVTNSGTITLGANTTNFSQVTNSSGGSLNTGTGQLNISGNFSNAGTLTQGTGTIAFNGTSAQSLVNTSATAVTFSKVTFSGAGAKTINSGTGNFAVASTGLLTMTSPATLSAGPTTAGVAGYLTLKSDASGSATVTSLAAYGTTKPITGNVNVERYFTGGESYSRGYRVISSPVSISSSNLVLPSLSYIKAQAYTTGSTAGSTGFDVVGNPTFYFYRENMVPAYTSFLSGNFRGVSTLGTSGLFTIDVDNTTQSFPAGNGFLFFFRGNRASNATVDPSAIAQTATFTATGFLNQGSITVTHWAAAANSGKLLYTDNIINDGIRGYNLVGNPYASSIDWDKFGTAAITGTNIDSTIRIYNPRLKAYATYIAGHAGIGVNFDTSNQPNANIIVSGQGFFVKAKAANPTLTFTEAAKVNTQVTSTSLLMSAPGNSAGIIQQQKIMGQSVMGTAEAVETAVSSSASSNTAKPVMQYVRLEIVKDVNNKDESIIFFKNGAKPHFVKNEDAEYMKGNNVVNLSTRSSDNKELAINEIAYPAKSFAIPLTIKVPSTGIYQINSTDVKNIPPLYSIWLMDKWRKDSLDIKANKTYNFNVNLADTTSFSPNRFTIVVRQNPELALALTKFTAAKSTVGAQLNWATVNESNYTAFTVERSTDNGKSWDIVGALQSSGKGKYALLDRYPVTGANQYRLKMTDFSGSISYSAINELMFTKQGEAIAISNVSIYPNPVSTTLNVAIVPQKGATTYTITVTSGNGTLVRSVTTADILWQNNVNNLMPGSYFVQVVNNNTKTIVGNGKFVKN